MINRKALLLLVLLTGMAAGAGAQENTGAMAPVQNPWYVGLQGGTSFGQCTFWSINQDGVRSWGLQGGLFGGYRFNRLISLEGGFQYGGQSQYNLECCPYWLSVNGDWKATQVIDKDGWYYSDIETATRWFKFALQGNFDMLSFIKGNNSWSLDLSPQISLVNTQTTWKGNLSKSGAYHEEAQEPNWHLGLGGQIAAGYAFDDNWKVGIYGGVTALTGKRFDMIPNKYHNTNLIWDAGLKLTYNFGGSSKKAQAEAALAAAQEAERLAAEQAAAEKAARLAAEKAERDRIAAEKAAREKAEREAAEKAAADKEAAFNTVFPAIYFAHASAKVDDSYIPVLEQALSILQQYPDFKLQVKGFASRSGSKAYNKALSGLRAEEVQYWFIGHQIAYDRVEDVQACVVDAEAAEKEGRRVEIKFVK